MLNVLKSDITVLKSKLVELLKKRNKYVRFMRRKIKYFH